MKTRERKQGLLLIRANLFRVIELHAISIIKYEIKQ